MKFKKIKLLVVFLFVFMLFGCGKSNENNEAKQEKEIVLKVAHVEPETRSTNRALLIFKEEVEEASKGSIKIEIYPNGALGGDVQLTESVAMGTIDMALPSTSVLTSYTDNFGILDMPYLFISSEAAFNAMDGKMGEYFNEALKSSGLVNLGYTYNGPRSITNSVREVKKPEDLKGIKVRVMESPVFIDFFRTLGANPTPMSFTEVYTALQQGAVEAQENPPSLIFANKFYEVQKFLSITEHVHNFLAFIMNAEKFNSLSDEQKAILQEKAKKYIENQRKMELEDNNKYIELLGTEGKLKVNILTADEKEEFKKALQPMYDKYKKNFGDDLFKIADEYNK